MNSDTRSYLRSLAQEFNESTNAVRIELNRLNQANILKAYPEGNTIMYRANQCHPLFPEISSIVKKYIGLDRIIEEILAKLGDLKQALITGDYAEGRDTGIIDLVLVGEISQIYLIRLIGKAEMAINRKIRYLILNENEYSTWYSCNSDQKLVIY